MQGNVGYQMKGTTGYGDREGYSISQTRCRGMCENDWGLRMTTPKYERAFSMSDRGFQSVEVASKWVRSKDKSRIAKRTADQYPKSPGFKLAVAWLLAESSPLRKMHLFRVPQNVYPPHRYVRHHHQRIATGPRHPRHLHPRQVPRNN